MTLQTTPWDSAEYLKTDKDIAAYLEAILLWLPMLWGLLLGLGA